MGRVQVGEKFLNYFIKPNKSILINSRMQSLENFSCRLEKELIKEKDATGKFIEKEVVSTKTMADIGDASLWIDAALKSDFKAAKTQIRDMFGNLSSVENIMNRPKGALSIETKLLRGLEDVKTYNNFEEALAQIGDGIGSRVITKSLEKLSKNEIDTMISKMSIDGKNLSIKQKKLLEKYIYEKPLKESEQDEAFRLFERFAQPLIEKRSKEVVDTLTLGILKERIINEGLDINLLKKNGLFDDVLLERLATDDSIKPIKIKLINNYRGQHGLAEFSNNQIRQLADALNYKRTDGELLKIYSDPRGLNGYRYPAEEVAKQASKSIKASGYRTAQMNIVHSNGALGEIQFRGKYTNMIGEYEHIAYDLRQGKNTLGPVFDEYATAVSKLDDNEYAKYNEYLEKCYNYYNRLELGLPAIKPKLPTRFNKILSEENMCKLHDKNEMVQRELKSGFAPFAKVA